MLASLLAGPVEGFAENSGPFRPFLGTWRGTGQIVSNNGQSEPITCRATYDGGGDDRSLTQSLVCASDSFRLNVQSNATADGTALQGQWRETTRNVQGDLTGQVSAGDFEGSVSGSGFTAQISIRASKRRQAVRIQPSAGDIQSVDIVLTRQK